MILTVDYFRRHIPWSPRRILKILFLNHSRYSHISQPQVPFLINYDILRFYVSMNDVIAMHILQSQKYTTDKKLYNVLRKSLPFSDLISEVATR